MARKRPEDSENDSHPTAEGRNWHGGDRFLRGFGFRIAARITGLEPRWSLNGSLYTEAEAHAYCRRQLASVKQP